MEDLNANRPPISLAGPSPDFKQMSIATAVQFITSPIDLDHVDETLCGFNANPISPDQHNKDLSTQLAQKERDLIVAAELGKALLHKNEALKSNQESIHEQYNFKLEELEQEKHELRRRLDAVEAEYESRITELQTDVTSLRARLNDQQHHAKSQDRERSHVVDELAEQNQRLAQQLLQAAKTEENLNQQLDCLREQFNQRRVALHDQVQQLQSLKDEISFLTEKKTELEKRIQLLTDERDNLTENLDDIACKALMLERQCTEADNQLRMKDMELNELKQENNNLNEEVDQLRMMNLAQQQLQQPLSGRSVYQNDLQQEHQRQMFGFDAFAHSAASKPALPMEQQADQGTSLFNELEMADAVDDINSPLCGSQGQALLGGQLRRLSFLSDESVGASVSARGQGHLFAEIVDDEDNFECDEDFCPAEIRDMHEQDMDFYARLHNQSEEESYRLKQEVLLSYKQLRQMVKPGDQAYEVLGGDEDKSRALLEASFIQPVILETVLHELKGLMEDIAQKLKETEERNRLADHQTGALRAHLDSVKEQLSYCKQRLEAMTLQMDQQDSEMKQKTTEMSDLNKKLAVQRVQLDNLAAHREQLTTDQTILTTPPVDVAKDTALKKAWKDREDAVEKKNQVEVALTKAQIEMMTLDTQLMDTIQEKIRLSQQLDQWHNHYNQNNSPRNSQQQQEEE